MPTIFLKLLLGTFFIILLTQLSFDLSIREISIPVTGQSLAVLTVAALLGLRNGVFAIALYLILGGLGLPVFANGASGWEIFTKGSGGFLYGFLIAGGIMGWLAERWGIAHFLTNIGMMAISTAVILLFGVGHLATKYGLEKALEYGFYPFWPGAIIKIIAGAVIIWIWNFLFINRRTTG